MNDFIKGFDWFRLIDRLLALISAKLWETTTQVEDHLTYRVDIDSFLINICFLLSQYQALFPYDHVLPLIFYEPYKSLLYFESNHPIFSYRAQIHDLLIELFQQPLILYSDISKKQVILLSMIKLWRALKLDNNSI
jgi:hypothetical protein